MEDQESDTIVTLMEKQVQTLGHMNDMFRKRFENVEKEMNSIRKIVEEKESVSASGDSGRPRRKRATKTQPSLECRAVVRAKYRMLTRDGDKEFNPSEQFSAPENQEVTKKLILEVKAETDTFTSEAIRSAVKVFFKTRKNKARLISTGKEDLHRQRARRNGRKRDKLSVLRTSLQTINWEEEAKQEAQEILQPCFISSDESDYETEEGKKVLKGYRVKKLPWLRKKASTLKKKLRQHYEENLPRNKRALILPRSNHEDASTRDAPSGPEWAVRL